MQPYGPRLSVDGFTGMAYRLSRCPKQTRLGDTSPFHPLTRHRLAQNSFLSSFFAIYHKSNLTVD